MAETLLGDAHPGGVCRAAGCGDGVVMPAMPVIGAAERAFGEHKDVSDAWSKPIDFHESVTAQLDEQSLLRTAACPHAPMRSAIRPNRQRMLRMKE
ncbi:hypothetical protein [Burkholderia ambifaria]|uniref:hypothetical protein n=1 Tax=Burkholderia ambifaria TaxID=152480 RepID=UPI002FE1BD68